MYGMMEDAKGHHLKGEHHMRSSLSGNEEQTCACKSSSVPSSLEEGVGGKFLGGLAGRQALFQGQD